MEIKIKYLSSGSRLIESRMPGCPGRAEPSEAEHVLSPLSALQIDFQLFMEKIWHILRKVLVQWLYTKMYWLYCNNIIVKHTNEAKVKCMLCVMFSPKLPTPLLHNGSIEPKDQWQQCVCTWCYSAGGILKTLEWCGKLRTQDLVVSNTQCPSVPYQTHPAYTTHIDHQLGPHENISIFQRKFTAFSSLLQ